MLRSLAFALEAHGYKVAAFESWVEARDSAPRASLVIIDEELPRADKKACLDLRGMVPVLLLSGQEGSMADEPGLNVLAKPLSGADMLDAVSALRRNP